MTTSLPSKPGSQQADAQEILSLTGLRFIAALYVFVFHIHLRWPLAQDLPFLANIIGQGAVGMSLFFVLSGYVLALRYGDGKGNYRDYLRNRFSRIYPIYVVAAVLTLPWIGISLDVDSAYMFVRQSVAIALLVLANIFLIQAWFPSMSGSGTMVGAGRFPLKHSAMHCCRPSCFACTPDPREPW